MTPSNYIKGLVGLWLALPLTALNYWIVWDKLPLRVPMKFADNGQASRAEALNISLRILGISLFVTTFIGVLVGMRGS